MAEEGFPVKLNVYDLSQGIARQLSTTFLGKAIEAIWHTGVVVYGIEYYFGAGIQQDPAGKTPYGKPIKVVDLGTTHIPREVFEEYLQEISSQYTPETYNLLTHNCNNFTNEVAQFLVDKTIPNYILDLPKEVMSSPMGALIMPMIQRLETTMRSGAVPQAPQFVPSPAMPPSTSPRDTINSSPKIKPSSSVITANSASPVPPVVKPSSESEPKEIKDPLGDVRSRVQEEITKEFQAIMATGTLRASEAAALATRRVMERHGRLNVSMQG
ncbi:desumoylating isopeptidase 1 [Carex littledalei]|uniref:Desumoylating isopeptidase 1 n=1 Tax=Carex littledalei TaxID=544730 RepID=A0A833QRW7_9POAL|nr:desumoylating isopeptidase 1 [Carex littledalei]